MGHVEFLVWASTRRLYLVTTFVLLFGCFWHLLQRNWKTPFSAGVFLSGEVKGCDFHLNVSQPRRILIGTSVFCFCISCISNSSASTSCAVWTTRHMDSELRLFHLFHYWYLGKQADFIFMYIHANAKCIHICCVYLYASCILCRDTNWMTRKKDRYSFMIIKPNWQIIIPDDDLIIKDLKTWHFCLYY